MMALNVEILLEKFLAKVILFWERRVVVTIATANLVAHRLRNRKTMVRALSSARLFILRGEGGAQPWPCGPYLPYPVSVWCR
jgi:hypothetical protein